MKVLTVLFSVMSLWRNINQLMISMSEPTLPSIIAIAQFRKSFAKLSLMFQGVRFDGSL